MKPTHHSSDPLDGLLRAYFRSQMPTPWPAFRPQRLHRPTAPQSPWSGYASRLALAASVAFLLLTGYFLAGGSLGSGIGPHLGPLHEGKAAREPLPLPDMPGLPQDH